MGRPRQYDFRQHVRLARFDYRTCYAYFVTICVRDRECVFGTVEGDAICLSRRGMAAHDCWNDVPNHHPHVDLDAFVIMPNHVHGILRFEGDAPGMTGPTVPVARSLVGATPASRSPRSGESRGPTAGSLSAVIGSYKSAVTRTINRLRPGAATSLWQPNFYEHIIRTDRALEMVRDYIVANPRRWPHDAENPAGDGSDSVEAFVHELALREDLPLRGNRDAGVASTEPTDVGVAITKPPDAGVARPPKVPTEPHA